ncbi:MAG: malonyl-ACP O-methyltransferase BioC [Wenzhouxiangellaceae bacterium]|nr:malonyl-ACP O-methyltransferase BioC [Wenzhouxiangellaceae bacterium]
MNNRIFDNRAMRRAFGNAADHYTQRARVQTEVATRLLERLDGLKFAPKTIVDLGCGPGVQAKALAQRFGDARVVAMDWTMPMLRRAGTERGWLRKRFERVAADANALPLAESSVDLLYSNLMLQWCDDLPAMLNGFRRVLKPGGLVLFSTLGPDTLTELRQAWRAVDRDPHVSPFADVQTVGDAMMRAGFGEPVLDTDWITSTYTGPRALLDELKATGATYAGQDRARGLVTPGKLGALLRAYEESRLESGLYPATWEVVYASAWGPEEGAPIRNIHGEEASVSVASIGRRQR